MDRQWHEIMRRIASKGEPRNDRTGIGTRALFGVQARFDLRDGFPAVTTKRLAFGQVRAELAAFLRGAETLAEFNALGCTIWDANASAPEWKERQRFPGDVGRIYGVQWRRWRSYRYPNTEGNDDNCHEVDQIKALLDGLQAQPHGRRHVVTTWNPGELDVMCLPPCHVGFQCFASDDGKSEAHPRGSLDLEFRMRSLDVFLGMPFDVASYALLLHLLARETGRQARHLLMTSGDTHLYNNHAAQVETVLARKPFFRPALRLGNGARLMAFLPEDAGLSDYVSHPAVPAPMNL